MGGITLREAVRKLAAGTAKIARYVIEVLEVVLIVIFIVLAVIAIVYTFRDIVSLKVESTWSEINLVVTDILVVIILIELTRSFVISALGEKHLLGGFIELGIIILIREIAVSILSGDVLAALMASGGALLLTASLWIVEEKIEKLKLRKESEKC